MKKVSIALCTYNGEHFLEEQLETIATQTIPPFELVICDDASSDSTAEIIEHFAAHAAFPVKLHFNDKNLGYLKNFEKAISLCTGDIIALCDQDDRWHADKLKTLLSAFSNPKVGMVFSNAAMMDREGNLTGESLWDRHHFDSKLRHLFSQGNAYQFLYFKNVVSGCTMAFRRQWWPLIQPFPENTHIIHDGWIALMISLFAEIAIIDEPLINYRIHAGQATINLPRKKGHWRRKSKAQDAEKNQIYRQKLNQLKVIRERVHEFEEYIAPEKRLCLLECLKERELHLVLRFNIPRNKLIRYQKIVKELKTGRYHRFSKGFKSALGDSLRKSA